MHVCTDVGHVCVSGRIADLRAARAHTHRAARVCLRVTDVSKMYTKQLRS